MPLPTLSPKPGYHRVTTGKVRTGDVLYSLDGANTPALPSQIGRPVRTFVFVTRPLPSTSPKGTSQK